MNITLAEKIISDLVKHQQVQTFCLCPGGRNAPFVYVLSSSQLQVLNFFDERAAGFFALGRAQRDKKPVAVVTTSGTAVAELLPSVVEAYYSDTPLVLLTADRPSRYRGTAAPQAIEQIGIFSHYVEATFDLEDSQNGDLSSWSMTKPVHINVCFDEPLVDKKPKKIRAFTREKTSFLPPSHSPYLLGTSGGLSYLEQNPRITQKAPMDIVRDFCSRSDRPLVILSGLEPSDRLEKALKNLAWPIYAEALSGLRESPILSSLILKSGEGFLKYLLKESQIDGIIRIGRCPCFKLWRDLDTIYPWLPVLSVSDKKEPGRAGPPMTIKNKTPSLGSIPLFPALSFESFFQAQDLLTNRGTQWTEVFKQDQQRSHALQSLIQKYPLSELSVVQQLAQHIPQGSQVFLGNSLAIREWNLGATYQNKGFQYQANRGANGIDGLLSTFLGGASENQQNWCLLGDLSALYDMTSPWILPRLALSHCFIVIINNSGGQIFSSLFSDPLFLNSHNLRFQKWAEFWGMNYYPITEWPKISQFRSPAVIEIIVNLEQSRKLQVQIDQL